MCIRDRLNRAPKVVYVGKDIVLSGNFFANNFFKIRRTKSDNIKWENFDYMSNVAKSFIFFPSSSTSIFCDNKNMIINYSTFKTPRNKKTNRFLAMNECLIQIIQIHGIDYC